MRKYWSFSPKCSEHLTLDKDIECLDAALDEGDHPADVVEVAQLLRDEGVPAELELGGVALGVPHLAQAQVVAVREEEALLEDRLFEVKQVLLDFRPFLVLLDELVQVHVRQASHFEDILALNGADRFDFLHEHQKRSVENRQNSEKGTVGFGAEGGLEIGSFLPLGDRLCFAVDHQHGADARLCRVGVDLRVSGVTMKMSS